MSNRKPLKHKVSAVDDGFDFGVYVWALPEGGLFKDDDGNVLNIPSMRHDIEKMGIITKAAAYWGRADGHAQFLSGIGRATDAMYAEDQERFAQGLTPYGDIGAFRDELRNSRNRH
jgi:hypothetical protein